MATDAVLAYRDIVIVQAIRRNGVGSTCPARAPACRPNYQPAQTSAATDTFT
jgi:hypothetical protein